MRIAIFALTLLLAVVAVTTVHALEVTNASNDDSAAMGSRVPEVAGPSFEVDLHPLSPPNGPVSPINLPPRDCGFFSPPNGLSPVAIICPPATGGGTTTSAGGAALAYAGLGIAGLAVAMFAGGLALRVRDGGRKAD